MPEASILWWIGLAIFALLSIYGLWPSGGSHADFRSHQVDHQPRNGIYEEAYLLDKATIHRPDTSVGDTSRTAHLYEE
jgi:hypothetical protein